MIPRRLQVEIRRQVAKRKRSKCENGWPIDARLGSPPKEWKGWPDGKKFALALYHDVESFLGYKRCFNLLKLEDSLGFRSAFHFIPQKYDVNPGLRRRIVERGFEVGVHGLNHDGKLFQSERIFIKRTKLINKYLSDWGAVGFTSPSMHHNFDWMHYLNIQHATTTFDTDPFEPQPDGLGTIYPVWLVNASPNKGYVELPYTLPQDHTLYIVLKEENIDIWKTKLDWIAEMGGMALLNTHPDYMNFDGEKKQSEEYPCRFYLEFLEYIKTNYNSQCWHVLPGQIASFWKKNIFLNTNRLTIEK